MEDLFHSRKQAGQQSPGLDGLISRLDQVSLTDQIFRFSTWRNQTLMKMVDRSFRCNSDDLLTNAKLDLYSLAMEKIRSDMKELHGILELTQIQEKDSEIIKRDLMRICREYEINNPLLLQEEDGM